METIRIGARSKIWKTALEHCCCHFDVAFVAHSTRYFFFHLKNHFALCMAMDGIVCALTWTAFFSLSRRCCCRRCLVFSFCVLRFLLFLLCNWHTQHYFRNMGGWSSGKIEIRDIKMSVTGLAWNMRSRFIQNFWILVYLFAQSVRSPDQNSKYTYLSFL